MLRHCLQERATKHAQELQQASVHAVHELEAKVKQMQEQLDAAQQQLHAQKAEYGQQEPLAECSKHLEGLQRDLSTERQRMKQLSGKAQEVADAKQEVVQANKNLQVFCLLTVGTARCSCCTCLVLQEYLACCSRWCCHI